MRIIFSFLTSMLLLGCSSGLTVNVPETYQKYSEEQSGYLVGSLSATTSGPSSGAGLLTTLYIRRTGEADAITLVNDNSDADFYTDTLTGQLFSVRLPTGEYELFRVSFKGHNGNKSVSSQSEGDLGLNFTIEPGKVSYIGQFVVSSLVAKSKFWNQEYPSGYGFITHDYARTRDRTLFNQRNPELADLPFTTKMLAEINNRLVLVEP